MEKRGAREKIVTSPSQFVSISRLSEDCLDFFVWWKSEMLRMLPRLRRGETGSNQRNQRQVVISKSGFSFDGDVFQPLSALGETFRTLKSTGDFEGPVIRLVLDETQYLKRVISHRRLPLSMLKRAAELDILTETPFRLEDIYILLSAGQKREAAYFILRRDFVDEIRTQIHLAQVEVSNIYLGTEQVEVISGLRPGDFSDRPGRSMRKVLNYLFALSVLLACMFCVYQLQQKTSAAAEKLDAQIDEANKHAHAARSHYDEYARKSKQLQALKQSKKLEVVKAWEELSRILPDTAFLTDLAIRNDRMEITGFSEKPAVLIGSIEASPLFQRAQFTSPVVKIPGFTGDNFHISFEQEQ
jgi:general secretion pathway protein L